MKLHLALLFAVPLAFGCSFQRVVLNEPIVEEDVAFIVPNETTMAQVVRRMGAPDEISDVRGRLLFHYEFSSLKAVRVDFGWAARFWSPVSPPMNLGWTKGGTDVFLVSFDKELVVAHSAFARLDEAKDVSFWPF